MSLRLQTKFGEQYPVVIRSWQDHREQLSSYFTYTELIQCVIYTDNTVEGYHRQLREETKNKGVFTSDTALEKLVYLAYTQIRRKRTIPVNNLMQMVQQLSIIFGDKFRAL